LPSSPLPTNILSPRAAEHAAKLGKPKGALRVALAVQRDSFAQDVRAGVLEEVRRHGMHVVIDEQLPHEPDDRSVTLSKVER
jgi:branched-chain amino acid transport system substrate-binding protein